MACTLIGGFDEKEQPLLGSNSDNPYSTRTRVIVDESNGIRFVGTRIESFAKSVEWDDMVTRAVNDRGIAFTWSSVPCSSTITGTGLRKTGERLATATSIEDAVTTLEAGSDAVSGCFLIGDAYASEIGVIEVAGDKITTERVQEGVIARTNHFTSPALSDLEVGKAKNPYRHSAEKRADRARSIIDGHASVEVLISALTDHHGRERGGDYGWSVCNHGTTHGSVSSEVLDPVRETLHYSYGWPCGYVGDPLGESWNQYLPYDASMQTGEYTDSKGSLTALGVNEVLRNNIAHTRDTTTEL